MLVEAVKRAQDAKLPAARISEIQPVKVADQQVWGQVAAWSW